MFEAAEKKIELIVKAGSLLARPFAFWEESVGRAGARILSKMSSSSCDAYILSESSLFVWDRRIRMLTCGQTNLIPAAEFFFQELGTENIEGFFYERKNEAFPDRQATDFASDERTLRRWISGRSFCLGERDKSHLQVFQADGLYRPADFGDKFEVLMYGATAFLAARSRDDLRALAEVFGGFQIDDHVFDPRGYSLNALRGAQYYTIHFTPGERSYLSFEGQLAGVRKALIKRILEAFRPEAYDIVDFISRRQGLEVQYTTSDRMPLDLRSDQGEHHLQWSRT